MRRSPSIDTQFSRLGKNREPGVPTIGNINKEDSAVKRRWLPRDCAMLFLLATVVSLPYVFKLGFYLDDWDTMAALSHARAQNVLAMQRQLVAIDDDMAVRPAQSLYLVLAFKQFGTNPLPYHAIETFEVALASVLLYVVAAELRLGRLHAFTFAFLFASLPQYSTDRFWVSAQQISQSMILALLGILALLRWMRSSGARGWFWLVVATIAIAVSLLSYEVCLGLISIALIGTAYRKMSAYRKDGISRFRVLAGMGLAISLLVALGLIKIHHEHRIVYHHNLSRLLGHLVAMATHFFTQAFFFNFWTYLIALPHTLRSLFAQSAIDGQMILAAVLISAAASVYMMFTFADTPETGRRLYLAMIAAGPLFFWIGALLLAPQRDYNFVTPSSGNRVAMASALGPAFVWLGLIGLLCSLVLNKKRQRVAFALFAGVAGGLNLLIVLGNAHYWVLAAHRQDVVLATVRQNMPALPTHSTLILDGFCPYEGPGPVFESNWYATGALRLTRNDETLFADILSEQLGWDSKGVHSLVPGEDYRAYPYRSNLYVYNTVTRQFVQLTSESRLIGYLNTHPPRSAGDCPHWEYSNGVKIF